MAQAQKSFWRSTQDFLAALSHANAQTLIQLRDELAKLQNQTDHPLTVLKKRDLRSLKKTRKYILNDASLLTKNNSPEIALKILEVARNLGISSSQLEAARAEALTSLNQHEEALQIWREQSSSNQLQVKNQANTQIRSYEQERSEARKLLQDLRTVLQEEKMQISHLPEIAPREKTILERFILNEAISLRNNNQEELSLRILDGCIQYGLNTDLVLDNKARALFNLGRKSDAIHIWQSLASSENPKTKSSAQKILDQLSQKLLTSLKHSLTNNLQPIQYLPEFTPEDLSKLGLSILKESIALRKEKQEELSLKMLNLTISAGFETDAINENKARALLKLGQNTEAVKLLAGLLSSKNPNAQESSKKLLENLGQKLIKTLKDILIKNGHQAIYLPEYPNHQIFNLESPILREAIELRKNNFVELSLKILDATVECGLKTDRIDDNRARALVNLKQYSDAVKVWESLTTSTDEKIRKSAALMLERFGDIGMQQQVLSEVDNLLEQKDGGQKAIKLLTDAIIRNPEDVALQEKLDQVALVDDKQHNDNKCRFDELSNHIQELAGFEAFISAIEMRYKPALNSAESTQKTEVIE